MLCTCNSFQEEADAPYCSSHTANSFYTVACVRKPEIASTVLSHKWVKSPILVVPSLHRTTMIGERKNESVLCKNLITTVEFHIQGLDPVWTCAELRESTGRKHSLESCSNGFGQSGPLTSACKIIRLSEVFQETVSLFVPFFLLLFLFR